MSDKRVFSLSLILVFSILQLMLSTPAAVHAAGDEYNDDDEVGGDPFWPPDKKRGDTDCGCLFFALMPVQIPMPWFEVFPTEHNTLEWYDSPNLLDNGLYSDCRPEDGYAEMEYFGTAYGGTGHWRLVGEPNVHHYKHDVTANFSWQCRKGIWQLRKMDVRTDYEGSIRNEQNKETYHGSTDTVYILTSYPNYAPNPSAVKIVKYGDLEAIDYSYDDFGNLLLRSTKKIDGKASSLNSGNIFVDHNNQSIRNTTAHRQFPDDDAFTRINTADNTCSIDRGGIFTGANYSEIDNPEGSLTSDKFDGKRWAVLMTRARATILSIYLSAADYLPDEGFTYLLPYVAGIFNSETSPWAKEHIKAGFEDCTEAVF